MSQYTPFLSSCVFWTLWGLASKELLVLIVREGVHGTWVDECEWTSASASGECVITSLGLSIQKPIFFFSFPSSGPSMSQPWHNWTWGSLICLLLRLASSSKMGLIFPHVALHAVYRVSYFGLLAFRASVLSLLAPLSQFLKQSCSSRPQRRRVIHNYN